MLSIEKNFLFIHAPKTGGTSIKNILKKYQTPAVPGVQHALFFEELKDKSWQDLHEYYDKEITAGNQEVIQMLESLPNPLKEPDEYVAYNKNLKSYFTSDFHLSASQWRDLMHPALFDSLIKFGVARNPYDRVISIHLWQNNGIFDKALLVKKLKDYAYLLYNEFNPCAYYFANVSWVEKEIPKLQEIKEKSSASRIDMAINAKPALTFFLKYETQLNQETMNSLCKTLNIEPVEFLHLNKNKRKKDKHYSHYYDDELYNLVTELYEIDLTTFDYKFEDKR